MKYLLLLPVLVLCFAACKKEDKLRFLTTRTWVHVSEAVDSVNRQLNPCDTNETWKFDDDHTMTIRYRSRCDTSLPLFYVCKYAITDDKKTMTISGEHFSKPMVYTIVRINNTDLLLGTKSAIGEQVQEYFTAE